MKDIDQHEEIQTSNTDREFTRVSFRHLWLFDLSLICYNNFFTVTSVSFKTCDV